MIAWQNKARLEPPLAVRRRELMQNKEDPSCLAAAATARGLDNLVSDSFAIAWRDNDGTPAGPGSALPLSEASARARASAVNMSSLRNSSPKLSCATNAAILLPLQSLQMLGC